MFSIILEIYGNTAIYYENAVCVCYTDSDSVGTISIRIVEGGMSRNKAVFGIGILCFTAGMYFGGILAEVKRPEFPTEEQETRRTWER